MPRRPINLMPLVLLALLALLALTGGGEAPVSAQDDPRASATSQGDPVALETAILDVEYNATDGDLGVHGAFAGEGWAELRL